MSVLNHGEVYNVTSGASTTAAYDSGATGTNRKMVAWVFYELVDYTAPLEVTAFTYDSVSLTERVTREHTSSSSNTDEGVKIFTLANPATGENTLDWTIDSTGQDFAIYVAVFDDAGADDTTASDDGTLSGNVRDVDITVANNSQTVWGYVADRSDSTAPASPHTNGTLLSTNVTAAASAGFRYAVGWTSSSGATETCGTSDGSYNAGGAIAALEILEPSGVVVPVITRHTMNIMMGNG